MPENLPELSKAEWLIMQACWDRRKSATAREIHEAVADARDWEYQTVKTMLDRLVEKGYLRREKVGPISLFATAVPRTKVVRRAIDGFVETVLGNELTPLLVHLAGSEKWREADLAVLKKLLEEEEK
jgi:predicted transcriptional regulator